MTKAKSSKPRVAYFCMEFGLAANFRIYAGGLGILAGDYLKGARDLRLPIVGVGLLWKQGYGDQVIGADGQPFDAYRNRVYDFLKDTGVRVNVRIRRRKVVCKVWRVDAFGNSPLYLLDTDLPENADAWITGQLYGWFGEERIAQEMVLGIGGVRALRALKIPVDRFHLNEGHAVFAALELIRERRARGMTYRRASAAARRSLVFTTHTPVREGNESHPLDRLHYMGAFHGLSAAQMKAIGGSPFNMTVAALRLSRKANAVAQLHGQTANRMWTDVAGRAKIVAITNGVHRPTWVDPRIVRAARGEADLWQEHMEVKKELMAFIRKRAGVRLRPAGLLIGFARRAVPYKRSDLIFRRPAKLAALLRTGRLQIVFSGKAHPLDDEGKATVARLVRLSRRYPRSVVFLDDYDMEIGAWLTRGVDVWLNNPVRPLEACGTSGMKAAMNGALNLSTLDGWWPEACEHGVNGWQFGDGMTAADVPDIDRHDGEALYDVLLNEVVPTYYGDRAAWIDMMRASIRSADRAFSVNRMLREYYARLY